MKPIKATLEATRREYIQHSRRSTDGTVFQHRCRVCGSLWKGDQREYHNEGCPVPRDIGAEK